MDRAAPDAPQDEIGAADFAVFELFGHFRHLVPVTAERVEIVEGDVDGAVVRRAGRGHDADEGDEIVGVGRIAIVDAADGIEGRSEFDPERAGDLITGDGFAFPREGATASALPGVEGKALPREILEFGEEPSVDGVDAEARVTVTGGEGNTAGDAVVLEDFLIISPLHLARHILQMIERTQNDLEGRALRTQHGVHAQAFLCEVAMGLFPQRNHRRQ